MKKLLLIILSLFLSVTVNASRPEYFTDEIDKEFRDYMFYVDDLLPQTDAPLLYLPLFRPFNLLDVRALNLHEDQHKQQFANFNFGVFASQFLNLDRKLIASLVASSICKEEACTNERIDVIHSFLSKASAELEFFQSNDELFIVQQTDEQVYRVNNAFYTPVTIVTYYPTEHAGFVPSSKHKVAKVSDNPTSLLGLSKVTEKLRLIMGKYQVAAITKINNDSMNIIFGGFADNHWGVVIDHHETHPKKSERNHIGLEYDVIKSLSSSSFYYQTN